MDSELRIKTYNPDVPTYAPRIRNQQWGEYQSILKQLHEEGCTRAAMLEALRERGFNPSMGQLNAKMTAWGYKVYGSQNDQSSLTITPTSTQADLAVVEDLDMADVIDGDTIMSFQSDESASSRTLVEPRHELLATSRDEMLSLDEIIARERLGSTGTYQPKVTPLDLGLKPPAIWGAEADPNIHAILSVADFLRSVHYFDAAFDLYYSVFKQFLTNGSSLVQVLINCAMCATTSAQCSYVRPIIEKALEHCNEQSMPELRLCFLFLFHDLSNDAAAQTSLPFSAQYAKMGDIPAKDIPALLAVSPDLRSIIGQKEDMQQKVSKCDRANSTLNNLVLWCLETLSYYEVSQPIGKHLHKAIDGYGAEMAAFEHDFQTLVSILVIDYLNSPGLGSGAGSVACQDSTCPFRHILSPVSSLVTIARILLAPSRLPVHGSNYLKSRSKAFLNSRLNLTTASDELQAFLHATTDEKRETFINIFLQSSTTSLKFRRLVSGVRSTWDRVLAAKRLARILQKNSSDLSPHAGLPILRRSAHKALAAPFEDDMVSDNGRGSVASASSSIKDFHRLASQLRLKFSGSGPKTPSDAMSIDTRSSWSFHHVTGFSHGPVSRSNSILSRNLDSDETEESWGPPQEQ